MYMSERPPITREFKGESKARVQESQSLFHLLHEDVLFRKKWKVCIRALMRFALQATNS